MVSEVTVNYTFVYSSYIISTLPRNLSNLLGFKYLLLSSIRLPIFGRLSPPMETFLLDLETYLQANPQIQLRFSINVKTYRFNKLTKNDVIGLITQ